jgi:hypothetical protein
MTATLVYWQTWTAFARWPWSMLARQAPHALPPGLEAMAAEAGSSAAASADPKPRPKRVDNVVYVKFR